MEASTFAVVSIGCFVLSITFLIVTIFLYFHYDIKEVYNFLTGKTALSEINEISKGTYINKRKSGLVISKDENKTVEISSDNMTRVLSEKETTILDNSTIELMNQRIDEEIIFILEETEMVINTKEIIAEVKG
ncbi:hypothetical protein [Thomasclavelia saccharogumia]|uniref:hypothetical protein n=1 Tax=Thomasclavelia saccharogumia TaxID=341225 RepID=UPI00047E1BA2|nr:hypothetical protein [Thomasclavelia saccharogumia]